MKYLNKLRRYFLSDFESNNFMYLLYPFLRIFKLFALVPIKMGHGEMFAYTYADMKLHWDNWAVLWSVFAATALSVGFIVAVHHLSIAKDWAEASLMTNITNWVQIVALFALGLLSLVTSWTTAPPMQRVCKSIARIDCELEIWTKKRFDYTQLRRCMFLQLSLAMFVPIVLSMVNCVVIQPEATTSPLYSTCYWFICFLPILLVTLKEFQFYNLIILLETKFACVNAQLDQHIRRKPRATSNNAHMRFARRVHSLSEIPLTAISMPSTASIECQRNSETLSVEELQALLRIYTYNADNVARVLGIFAWHLLLLTTISFGVITIQGYNLFAMIMHSIQVESHAIGFIIAWIIVQLTVIGINVGACSKISKTMSATGPLLHKIRVQELPIEDKQFFCQIVQIFSMEVLQRKNSLTAAGFFSLDPKLITSIIAASTTYLVIIIQFHLSNIHRTL